MEYTQPSSDQFPTDVKKIQRRDNLQTQIIPNFFNNTELFEIEKMFVYQKKEMKTFIENKKMNVTIRNFPETVAQIRKKWKIKDGGEIYSFFTTNAEGEKIVLLCKKITN